MSSELQPNPHIELPSTSDLYSTHTNLAKLRRYVDIPQSVRGRRILDIGASTSTANIDLVARGAYVVALDLRYGDRALLEEGSDVAFAFARQLTRGNIDAAIKIQNDLNDRKRFLQDFDQDHAVQYIGGTFTALPFGNNTFDDVFSTLCLSHFFKYPELFLKGAEEATRVARNTVQISPWNDRYFATFGSLSESDKRTLPKLILDSLKEKGIKFRLKQVNNSYVQCLELQK